MSAFRRRENQRSYRKNFHFVTEGEATEKAYLQIVWNRLQLRERYSAHYYNDKSSIPSLLSLAERVEKSTSFNSRKGDEIWIVLDYDGQSHFPEQFVKLAAWEKEYPYRHVAISSPRFEYWLLWHLDDHPNKDRCKSDDYMHQRLSNFKKLPLTTTAITRERILEAMHRANSSALPNCETPSIVGSSLGLLIKRLIQ